MFLFFIPMSNCIYLYINTLRVCFSFWIRLYPTNVKTAEPIRSKLSPIMFGFWKILKIHRRILLHPRFFWLLNYTLGAPSKSHVWCPNKTNNIIKLESFCALLLESAKTLAKIDFFSAKSNYVVKLFAIKIPKNDKIYIFKKPFTSHFKYAKKNCKILNNLSWTF